MSRLQLGSNSVQLTVTLGLLAALPALSIDISFAAFWSIQHELNASSGPVGLTITFFMAGFAFGQFGTGPLSDRFGRRPLLLGGLLGYVLAGAGCASAGSVEALVLWRLAQGLAAGSCSVLAFTIIHDVFEGDAARSMRSHVTVVFGLAPMLAPTLGALILNVAGWRTIFTTLTVAGLVLLAVVAATLPESKPKRPIVAGRAFRDAYVSVLSDHRFFTLAMVNALSYGGVFAYIAGSSVVLMESLEMSPGAYAAFFACTAAALTAGAWTSGRCASAGVGSPLLMWVSLGTAAVSALAMSVFAISGMLTLPVLGLLLMLNLFSRGLVAPTAQHMALDPLRENAGTAAAAVGVLQISCGALTSAIVATLLPLLGPLGMTGVMAALAVAALALWTWLALRPVGALP